MELLHAIYRRRAVRAYTDVPVHPAMIHDLLKAAVQAPSAVNQQAWAFAVIRGHERLDRYSERAKTHLLAILPQLLDLHQRADALARPVYNVFHRADTVVVIYTQPAVHHPADECLFAAQNLMLAAHGMGLGTCPIGFARPWFDLGATKRELGIPETFTAIMPLTVGWPAEVPPAPPRHEPNIVCWLDDRVGA